MSGFQVLQPGVLSLLQDGGRVGRHQLGMANGGPVDAQAMYLANRLLGNALTATAIEVSFSGLQLEARVDTCIAYTGGDAPLSIADEPARAWRVHRISAGSRLRVGVARHFCRSYLAVAGGFTIPQQFGSTATVVREGLGGTSGLPLQAGEMLPCAALPERELLQLAAADIPHYETSIRVRVIPGYQIDQFPRLQRRRFFNGHYQVSQRADRMGYRLQGPAITAAVGGILSEGICQGAVQVPADGQPIVLLNDRQTIGGYPKLGAALSLDSARLGQLTAGAEVQFEPVDSHTAHNALHLHHYWLQHLQLEPVE